MKFSDLLLASVKLKPRLVRPDQAALVLGSGTVVADFVAARWLSPVISRHRLVLYSYPHLEACVARLEMGEMPLPDGFKNQIRPPGEKKLNSSLLQSPRSFAEQLRNIISIPPLLVRPEQAAAYLGSVELFDDLRIGGWLKPVYAKPNLTVFSVRHLDSCVIRLETGRISYPCTNEAAAASPTTSGPEAESLLGVVKKGGTRKTRRPMPPEPEQTNSI